MNIPSNSMMKLKYNAVLKTDSRDAKSVANALNKDNVTLDGLRITTGYRDKKVITEVSANSMKSLLSTLDDIILCQIVAENVLIE